MSPRDRALVVVLWIAVLMLATWIGGTLYQMIVVVPLWSADPPTTVRAFFAGTAYNRTVQGFFGPPFMAARMLPLVLALGLAWHRPAHRRPLLVAVGCFVLFAVPFTVLAVYPINAVLFDAAGGTADDAAIRAMAGRWILYDRLRFAVGVVGFVALLHAFRLPFTPVPTGRPRARG